MGFLNTLLSLIKTILGMSKTLPSPTVPSPAPVAQKEAPMAPQEASSTPVIDPNSFSVVALPLILIFEGSFTDNPNDRGGRTNRGITQRTYDSYRQILKLPLGDVENITDSEVSAIYYNYYWLPTHCDKMPEKVAVVCFDTAVNSGTGRSAKTLQQVLGVTPDGVIGPATLAKLMTCDPLDVANSFLTARVNFYNNIVAKNPDQQVFLKGWLRRVSLVKDFVNGVKNLSQVRASW
jgi:lysozyme family protein